MSSQSANQKIRTSTLPPNYTPREIGRRLSNKNNILMMCACCNCNTLTTRNSTFFRKEDETSCGDSSPEDDEAAAHRHLESISTIMDDAEVVYKRFTDFRGFYEDDSYQSIELALIRLSKRLDAIKVVNPTVLIEKNKTKQYLCQLMDMLEALLAENDQEL